MVHVKICGITNLDDALFATDAGADMLGFVFYAQSPRYIPPEPARDIITALRSRGVAPKCVGVFVNEPLDRVRTVMTMAQLDLVQLHGDEPVEALSALSPRAVKALRPNTEEDARAAVSKYHASVDGNTPAFLVDAYETGKFGGTGARADWAIAAQIARQYPILLAGGLSPDNAAEAIHAVLPWGVDVSTGVERAPGLKDHTKVREFIQRVKSGLV
jgi:phosphoribosylanthranilate isomerase